MESIRPFALSIGMLFVSVAQSAIAKVSHCSKDERVIFNCHVGKNAVSICASTQVSHNLGYVQYRFGRVGKPSLIYPVRKSLPDPTLRADMLTYSGGGGAYMRFINDNYSYVVYSAIGRGWGERAGVVVERNHKVVADFRCKKPVVSELGPDLFDQANFEKDLESFDIP